MSKKIHVIDLKKIGYQEAYTIQKNIFKACDHNETSDTILFQENPPTITIGRGGSLNHLLISEQQLKNRGIDLVHVDRGGDITFHGPGQCVISLILHLKEYTNNIHDYLRKLEEAVMLLLSDYKITAHRIEGYSGVWVGSHKIASVGIAIEHGITRHGIAINVDPDLSFYDVIIACGIKDVQVTSIKKLTGKNIDIDHVKQGFLRAFKHMFDVEYINEMQRKEPFMKTEVKIPNFAEGGTKIKLRQWLVEVGQVVKAGDNVAEAATDKISVFIEAPASGKVVSLLAEENDTVFIGDVIAEISDEE